MTTSPAVSSAPDAPPPEQPKERLSLTQVLASALATITATAALSLFGVAGTVIGAALASVLTVVGNHLYTQSIKRTQARVLAGTAALRTRATVVVGDPHRTSTSAAPAATANRAGAAADLPAPHERRVLDLGSRKRLLLTTLAVFVAILAAVTAFEILAGKPLSDVVRDQGGSGLSLGSHVDSPAPTTKSNTPSGSASTSTTPSTSATSSASSSSTGQQTSGSTTSSTASATTSTSTTAPPTNSSSTTRQTTTQPATSGTTGAG